jgi:hypothetical protein
MLIACSLVRYLFLFCKKFAITTIALVFNSLVALVRGHIKNDISGNKVVALVFLSTGSVRLRAEGEAIMPLTGSDATRRRGGRSLLKQEQQS